MKKVYSTPEMIAVRIQHTSIICTSVTSFGSNNAGIGYGGAGDGTTSNGGAPRAKESVNVWDEEW